MIEETYPLEVVSIRMIRDVPILSEHKIQSPEDAVAVLGEILCEVDREVVCAINLRADGTPINCNFVSIGALNECRLSPRELFKTSILSNAASLIVLHNHPSGALFPSRADCIMTDKLIQLGNMMEIPLLDHVIVGGDNREYFSFREKGVLENPHPSYCSDYRELSFSASKVAERQERTVVEQTLYDRGTGTSQKHRSL